MTTIFSPWPQTERQTLLIDSEREFTNFPRVDFFKMRIINDSWGKASIFAQKNSANLTEVTSSESKLSGREENEKFVALTTYVYV